MLKSSNRSELRTCSLRLCLLVVDAPQLDLTIIGPLIYARNMCLTFANMCNRLRQRCMAIVSEKGKLGQRIDMLQGCGSVVSHDMFGVESDADAR